MNKQPRSPKLETGVNPTNLYDDITLGGVVTRQEAAYLWGKSLSGIDSACLRGKINHRKSLSGGSVLITVSSLVLHWGLPVKMTLWDCFMGQVEMTANDALELFIKKESEEPNG